MEPSKEEVWKFLHDKGSDMDHEEAGSDDNGTQDVENAVSVKPAKESLPELPARCAKFFGNSWSDDGEDDIDGENEAEAEAETNHQPGSVLHATPTAILIPDENGFFDVQQLLGFSRFPVAPPVTKNSQAITSSASNEMSISDCDQPHLTGFVDAYESLFSAKYKPFGVPSIVASDEQEASVEEREKREERKREIAVRKLLSDRSAPRKRKRTTTIGGKRVRTFA